MSDMLQLVVKMGNHASFQKRATKCPTCFSLSSRLANIQATRLPVTSHVESSPSSRQAEACRTFGCRTSGSLNVANLDNKLRNFLAYLQRTLLLTSLVLFLICVICVNLWLVFCKLPVRNSENRINYQNVESVR